MKFIFSFIILNNKKRHLLICLLCGFIISYAQKPPTPAFNIDKTTGCGIIVIQLKDNSLNNPSAWLWKIYQTNSKDTIKLTLQNPILTLKTIGTYNISLTVSNAYGKNTITSNNAVNLFKLPVSDFSADITSGCSPLSVSFTDKSTIGSKPLKNWFWNFGDGNYSALQNPKNIFIKTGIKQVSLTVVDNNNCESSPFIKTINILDKPKASFVFVQDRECPLPVTVNFTNTSTGNIITTDWLSDGIVSSTQNNPSFSYNTTGTHTIRLIATGTNGCKDTILSSNFIKFIDFNIKIGSNVKSGCVPLSVNFIDSTFITGVTYLWNFGDGTSSTETNPKHNYINSGTYTVTLQITNKTGCVKTQKFSNYITVYNIPVINFTADKTINCSIPFTVNFSDKTPSATKWEWDFGDGSLIETIQNPSHTFSSKKLYAIKLKVTDNNGCSNNIAKNNFINTLPVIARFNSSVQQGCAPLTVNFNDLSTSSTIVKSRLWNFGNGITSTLVNPTIIFSDTGKFCVTLKTTDMNNCVDSVNTCPYIKVGNKPKIKFTYVKDSVGCNPFTPSFKATAPFANKFFWIFGDGKTSSGSSIVSHSYIDTSGYFDVTLIASQNGCADTLIKAKYIKVNNPLPRFLILNPINCDTPHTVLIINRSKAANKSSWTWGDGSPAFISSKDTVSHVYHNLGTRNVTLQVTNDTTRCVSTLSGKITTTKIKANFSQDTSFACANTYISFKNKSYSFFKINKYEYDYGDNQTSSDIFSGDIFHKYGMPGLYSVKFKITDNVGCKDSITKINSVRIYDIPNPDFTSDVYRGCENLMAQFKDLSTSKSQFPMKNWFWMLGDASNSNARNPNHLYLNSGTYNVSLQVTDSIGCSNTVTKMKYIKLTKQTTSKFELDSLLNISKNRICYSDSAYFKNLTKGVQLRYYWNFNDGTPIDSSINPIHVFKQIDSTKIIKISLIAIDTNECQSPYVGSIEVSHPKAYFGSDFRSAECLNPIKVFNFSDSSSTDVSSWTWNFGDPSSNVNNISFLKNTTHSFKNTGKYDISLIVKNIFGCVDTLSQKEYISINGPNGTFNFTPQSGCIPLDVLFKANTINTDKYKWIFGDGRSISSINDSIVYTFSENTDNIYHPILILETKVTKGADSICQVIINSPDSVVVFSKPFVNAGKDSTICQKQNIKLTAIGNGSFLWNNNKTSSEILESPDTTSTYYITVTSAHNCINQDTVIVFVNPLPKPEVNQDTSVCRNVELTLFASGGGTYLWNIPNEATSQIIIHPNVKSTYIVTITNEFGCTDKDSAVVSISDSLHPKIIGKTEICVYDSTQLTVTGGGTKFIWSSKDTLPTINTHALTNSTIYRVTISDTLGCSGQTQLIVDVKPLPIPDVGMNDSVCEGHSLTLTATGGLNYSWNTKEQKQIILITPKATFTTYSVTVTNNWGCSDKDTVIIKVNPNPIVQAGKDTSICEGVTVTLTASGTDSIFKWNTDETFPRIKVTPHQSTTYSVILYNKFMCTDTALVKIIVFPAPLPPEINEVILCSNDPEKNATLEIQNSNKNLLYTWYKTNTETDPLHKGNSMIIHNVIKTENYFVEAKDTIGCNSLVRGKGTITIADPPLADFKWEPQQIWEYMEVNFTNNSIAYSSSDKMRYIWDFGDKNNLSIVENPTHIFRDSGVYNIQLIATDNYNCKDTASKTLIVLHLLKLWVPDAFTPNHDSKNDLLFVRGPAKYIHFEIYNQWGYKIYFSDNQTEGWDGTYKGIEQPEGNYVWRLNGQTIDGKNVQIQGITTLVR